MQGADSMTKAFAADLASGHGVRSEDTAGQEGSCRNCGAGLLGDYCHRCGQQGHLHSTVSAFWHDLVHGVLHFDGKIWRTLPLLAWRPGELTRRYVAGERMRFVSPTALFLFSVLLMFVTYNTVGAPTLFRTDLPGLAAAPKAPAAARRDVLDVDRGLARLRKEQAQRERDEALRAGGQRSVDERLTFSGGIQGQAWYSYMRQKIRENPSLLIYKLQNNAYKFSWALIPISVPFLWLLLFWKRRYGLYEHTVFITYSITFMTLMIVFFSLLHAVGLPNDLAGLAITLIPPAHIYRQLRGAYGLSRLEAIWRALLLTAFALVAAGLFFSLLLFIGVAG